jgi:4-hydroxybenzoate polyprenyltransferase
MPLRVDEPARAREPIEGTPSGEAAEIPASNGPRARPLVVDLDGTLVASDLLIETALSELGRRPGALVDILAALARGKVALTQRLAAAADFDPSLLPYDPEVLAVIRQAVAEGRPVYLAAARDRRHVARIADHLGFFAGWFALDETTNCAGAARAKQLVEAFGERGFDYVGNDAADLPVWEKAARAIAIRTPARVKRRLSKGLQEVDHLPCGRPTWRAWAKLLRVHQYAKNALVLVPLLTAHLFNAEALVQALVAALAFSLCASSVYILNDLVDLQDDREHRSKRGRPLASGAIPLGHGLIAAPLLLLAGVAVAAAVSLPFLGVLLGYFALTTAYSFVLKRVMLVDVLTLAGLYSIRVFGGAVAIGVTVSEWLLGFCMMLFMSLALIKRYVELAARRDAGKPDSGNRDYRAGDLDMVAALAAAAGFNAITVFALYISSATVHELYTRPAILWLVAALLLYWVARALMLASRRMMDDDPVVFALKDRVSLATIAIATLLVLAAA